MEGRKKETKRRVEKEWNCCNKYRFYACCFYGTKMMACVHNYGMLNARFREYPYWVFVFVSKRARVILVLIFNLLFIFPGSDFSRYKACASVYEREPFLNFGFRNLKKKTTTTWLRGGVYISARDVRNHWQIIINVFYVLRCVYCTPRIFQLFKYAENSTELLLCVLVWETWEEFIIRDCSENAAHIK